MLGFAPVQEYVHALEDRFRAPPAHWGPELLDRLFAGAVALRQAVEDATTEREADAFARLAALTPTGGAAAEEPSPAEAPVPVPAEPTEAAPAEPAPDGGAETLRVPWARLDTLLNTVADLGGIAAALADLEGRHRTALAEIGVRRPLREQVERLDRVAGELRRSAMEMRLVPVGRVFGRFPSLVGELARETGKRVHLEVGGEDTELDKSTVDALGEPLLHLVRNAVDHGAQRPEEREAAGKPPENTVRLRAEQIGDRVRITVEDDGRGLDREAIRARARAAGIRQEEAGADPAELIFRAGFSTRSEADAVSGRGLGLDIVRRAVERLRGTLAVDDAPGGGTRFTLRLPLTVALVPVILLEAAGELLALPAAEVEDMHRLMPVHRVGGAEVVRVDGETLPLARPAELFGWGGAGAGHFQVVVRRGSRAAAVVVDRLVDQRDLVVKALPAWLGQPPAVSGAAVAPDGRVILLLDPAGLLALNLQAYGRRSRAG